MDRFHNNPFAPLLPGDPHADFNLPMEQLPHPEILRAIGNYDIPRLLQIISQPRVSPEMESSIGYVSTFASEMRNTEMLEQIDRIKVSQDIFKWGNALEYAIETGDLDIICFLAPRYMAHFYPESKRRVQDPITK